MNEAAPAQAATQRTIGAVIVTMALVEALSGVAQGYLFPILPALGPALSIDDPAIAGIFLISNVSFAVLTPIISRLGDSYGYRRVLRSSAGIVAAGMLVMAFAPSLVTVCAGVVLITCVVGFVPLMMGILRVTSPEHTRTGVSVMIGVLMIMVGIGGLLGGLAAAGDPTAGLWIGVPFAIVAIVCTFLLPDAGTPTREPIRFGPMLACSLGLIGFVTALSQGPVWGWLDPRTVLSGASGLILLALWANIDARSAKPFVDLRMLAIPRIRTVSTATFFFGFASIGYFGVNGIFLHADPQRTGYGFGLSPLQIATVLAIASVLSLGSSLGTARALRVIGERAFLILAGLVLAGGFAVMVVAHDSLTGYCTGFALFNLSLGMYQSSTRALSVEGVPVEKTSTAAGLNELALSVGIAVGGAVIKLFSSAFAVSGYISEDGMVSIWCALALAALIAVGLSATYPRRNPGAASGTPTGTKESIR